MADKMRESWKADTNGKYSEVVKTIMGLATASLLLPVFMAREFLGIEPSTPLITVLGYSVYFGWGFLAISILAGVFFLYLSAKWIRLAWGKNAGLFFSNSTSESSIERFMEASFWCCIGFFTLGLIVTIWFFASYAAP